MCVYVDNTSPLVAQEIFQLLLKIVRIEVDRLDWALNLVQSLGNDFVFSRVKVSIWEGQNACVGRDQVSRKGCDSGRDWNGVGDSTSLPAAVHREVFVKLLC